MIYKMKKRNIKSIIKRIIAVILVIVMLPFSEISYIREDRTEKAYAVENNNISTETNDVDSKSEEIVQEDISTGVINDRYVLMEDKTIESLIINGDVDLNGHKLTVNGDIRVNGELRFNTGRLICEGDFTFAQEANCYMRDKLDYLSVGGDFFDEAYERDTPIMMIDGCIYLYGNYTAYKGIVYERDKTKYIGINEKFNNYEIGSRITFCGEDREQNIITYEKFNIVSIGASVINVTVLNNENNFAKVIYNDNNNAININVEKLDEIKLKEDTVISGDCTYTNSIVDLNGYTLKVEGDLSVLQSKIIINGGNLIVKENMYSGKYRDYINYYNQIIMDNENDYVHVCGKLMIYGNEKYLKKGEIIVEDDTIIREDYNTSGKKFLIGNKFYTNKLYIYDDVKIRGEVYTKEFWYDEMILDLDGGKFVVFNSINIPGIINLFNLNFHTENDVFACYGVVDSDFVKRGYADDFRVKFIENNPEYKIKEQKLENKLNTIEENHSIKNENNNLYLEEDTVINGDLVLQDNSVNLNGKTLRVIGDVIVNGNAGFYFNNGTLIVENDLFIYENNVLEMQSLDDKIIVNGRLYYNTIEDDVNLGKGTVSVYGDILPGRNKSLFCEGLILNGYKSKYIGRNSDYNFITVSNLIVDCDGNIITSRCVIVNNKLDVKKGYIDFITMSGNVVSDNEIIEADIFFENTNIVYEYNIVGDVYFCDNVNINNKINIDGNAIFDSNSINFNSDGKNGELVCNNFNYSLNKEINITSGIIKSSGNVSINNNFNMSGDSTLELNGNVKQILKCEGDFGIPSLNNIRINNTSKEGVELGVFDCKGTIDSKNSKTTYILDRSKLYDSTKKEVVIDGDIIVKNRGCLYLVGENNIVINGDITLEDGEIDNNLVNANLVINNLYIKNVGEDCNYYYGNKNNVIIINKSIHMEKSFDFSDSNVELFGSIISVKNNELKINNTLKLNSISTNLYRTKLTVGELICDSNTLDSSGEITSNKYVFNNNTKIKGKPILYINDINELTSSEIDANIVLKGNSQLNHDIKISGDLDVNCELNLGTNKLEANTVNVYNTLNVNKGELDANNLYIECPTNCSGKLIMNDDEGKIYVKNEMGLYATSYGAISYYNAYNLTAGEIHIGGCFNTCKNGYGVSFQNSGTNKIIFDSPVNGNKQSILCNGSIYINNLVLRRRLESGYYNFPANIEEMCGEITYIYDSSLRPVMSEKYRTDEGMDNITIDFEEATDDGTVVRYQIFRNDEKIAEISDTYFEENNLLPGTEYTYKIYAVDDWDNLSDALEISVKTLSDVEAPTVPGNLEILKITGKKITLNWNESTDNYKVAGYNVYRDGEKIGSVNNSTTYVDEINENGILHSYMVKAYDFTGNESEKGNVVNGYTKAPIIYEITPENGYSLIKGKDISVNIKVDNVGALDKYYAKIEYSYDLTKEWKTIADNVEISTKEVGRIISGKFNFDFSEIEKDGVYDFRITVTDEDGVYSQKTVFYLYDSTAPEVPEIIKGNVTSINGENKVEFKKSKSSDCQGYYIYRREENGENVLIKTINSKTECCFYDNDVEIDKIYYYSVSAFDCFENESEKSEEIRIKTSKDTEAPKVKNIQFTEKKEENKLLVEVEITDNKEVLSAKGYIKSENSFVKTELLTSDVKNGKAKFEIDLSQIQDGNYYIFIEATDVNNNTSDAKNAFKLYEHDTKGPSKVEIENEKCSTLSTSIQLRWKDVEETDFAYFNIEEICGDEIKHIANVSDTLGYSINNLIPNCEHTYQVTAYDKKGNRGETSKRITLKTSEDNICPVIYEILPIQSCYKDVIKLEMKVKDNYCVKKGVFSYSLDGSIYNIISEQEIEGSRNNTFKYNFDISSYPDGEIYIKFEAYDLNGNSAKLSDNTNIIAKYVKDSCAPNKPENVVAMASEGYIQISYLESNESARYNIYRIDENGNETLIANKITNLNYYDTKVECGKSYSYSVQAVDIAGNISEKSDLVSEIAKEDEIAPKVTNIITDYTEEDGSYSIGKNGTIRVGASDRSGLSNLCLYYKKTDDSDIYTLLDEVKGNSEILSITKSIDGIITESGEYEFRACAIDIYGNKSDDSIQKIKVFVDEPEEPVLICTAGGYKVDLKYGNNAMDLLPTNSEEDDGKLKQGIKNNILYKIYRKDGLDSEYKLISTTEENRYSDEKLKSNMPYTYKVEAVDKYENTSFSTEVSVTTTGKDDEAPTAILFGDIMTYVGHEITLNGMKSTDNVEIENYLWDLGNGDKVEGRIVTYKYETAGLYKLRLIVKDAAGNKDVAEVNVYVYNENENAMANVYVYDEARNALSGADVYVETPNGETLSLITDEKGKVEICGCLGKYRIAAYASGYIPKDETINLDNSNSKVDFKIVLSSGELVVGDLTVEKMNLEEIVESGVSLQDPDNINSYSFTVKLTFAETPIPREIEYINMGGFDLNIKCIDGKRVESSSTSGNAISIYNEEICAAKVDNDKPIIAIIRISNNISWLKEMYNVNLSLVNAAESQYVIKDSVAKINLSDGLSLARKKDRSESEIVYIGDIYGKEKKNVNWIVKGDKKGKYNISADFNGTLMPFGRSVNAHFTTDKEFEVASGEGIMINVYPEDAAYINKDYYIQYEITNGGVSPLYNFTTTIGSFEVPEIDYYAKIYYPDGTVTNHKGEELVDEETEEVIKRNEELRKKEEKSNNSWLSDAIKKVKDEDDEEEIDFSKISFNSDSSVSIYSQLAHYTIMKNESHYTIPVLEVGQTVYGTYKTEFKPEKEYSEKEKNEYYYSLIDAVVEDFSNTVEGVQVNIIPVSSHIIRSIIDIKYRSTSFGDPIDLSTGAFMDQIDLFSISNTDITMNYNSSLSDYCGDCGYGAYTNIYTHIEEDQGTIKLYFAPGIYGRFAPEQDAHKDIYANRVDDVLYISNVNIYGKYESMSSITNGYEVEKHKDKTYTVITPAKEIYKFNENGKLSEIKDENGNYTTFSYSNNQCYITEKTTNKSILLTYNENGLITCISDGIRTVNLAYEDLKLIEITDECNETRKFEYGNNIIDENNSNKENNYNKIVMELDKDNVCFVKNVYDEKGRVIEQYDAMNYDNAKKTDINSIEDASKYNIIKIKYEEDTREITDKETKYSINNGMTVTTTDKNSNNSVVKYDSYGRLVEQKDSLGNTTKITYGKNDNVTKEETISNKGISSYVSYSYDAKGRTVSVTDEEKSTTRFEYDDNDNITKVISPLGYESNYIYDKNNRLISVTDYEGKITTYTYNEDSNRISKVYVNNEINSEYSYDELGMLTAVNDANGICTRIEYDYYGNIISETDGNGNTKIYSYDLKRRITKETEADGSCIEYTYDKYGNIITETYLIDDVLQSTVKYEYDCLGNLVKAILPSGKYTSYKYDAVGNIIEEINPDLTSKKYKYDAVGNLISETNELGETITYEYDNFGNVISEKNSLGETITYEYYSNRKLKKIIYPDESVTEYTYDKDSNISTVSNNDKVKILYVYDKMSRVISATDALDNSVKYEYDAKGQLVKVTDKNNNSTTYTYDKTGKCISTTNALGNKLYFEYDAVGNITRKYTVVKEDTQEITVEVKYVYDQMGRLIKIIDEDGLETTYTYDNINKKVTVTDCFGNSTTNTYDIDGNIISTINAQNIKNVYEYGANNEIINEVISSNTSEKVTQSFKYDSAGRITDVTDANGNISSRVYDENGNVTVVTDANGGTTKYIYDSMGRVVTEINAIESKHEYVYNADGLLETYKNGRKEDTKYSYDELDRVVKISDKEGIIEYSYDNNGNVLSVSETKNNETKVIKRTYDELNRVTTYTDANGKTIKYAYDELGNRISLTYPGGEIVRYTYYNSGRLKAVTDSKGRVTHYAYERLDERNNLENITTISRPDGSVETNIYDSLNQLVEKKDVNKKGEVINHYKYTYDTRGNITSIEDNSKNSSGKTLTSDNALRLTGGNSAEIYASNPSLLKMEYDKSNRLIKYNGVEIKYDAEGNMIYGPVDGLMSKLTYDARNRLIKIDNSQITTTYEYDAENTRIKEKTEYKVDVAKSAEVELKEAGTVITTEYITDVESTLSQVLEIKETTEIPSASTQNIGSNTTAYKVYEENRIAYFGNELLYEDTNKAEIKSEENSGITSGTKSTTISSGTLYYHYNHLGSTTALTDAIGEIESTYTYGPYGEIFSGETDLTKYLYNGSLGVMTDDNGLYYMRSRYYNVSIKRFINLDVVVGNISNSQSLNQYSYVQGNPISYTDPFGLSPYSNGRSIAHCILSIAGMIPGIGDVFDLINMGLYLQEGKYKDAALCGLSALPFIGTIAGGALNMCKLGKVAKVVKTTCNFIGYGYTLGNATIGAIRSGKAVYNDIKNGDTEIYNLGKSLFLLGFNIFGAVASGRNFGRACGKMKNYAGNAWGAAKTKFTTPSKTTSVSTEKVVTKRDYILKYDLQFFASNNVNKTSSVEVSASEGSTDTITNDVLECPRTGSALKVDKINTIRTKNPYGGKPLEIWKEFPAIAQSHGFNDLVDNYAGYATKSEISNGTLYQLEGVLNGVQGRFEWIIQDGNVTHRMFIQNGTMNGVPIKP